MNITQIHKEVVIGCLLGDGCLEKPKLGKNACFKYLSSSRQHVEFVHGYLKDLCTDNMQNIKRREYFDKRTNKTYVNYSFKTRALPELTKIYYDFYTPYKIIPNIDITPTICLMWYIGDGELESRHGFIKFHTNCFSKDGVIYLAGELKQFDADFFEKGVGSKQYIIRIPRRNVREFLKYIGDCPFNDYQHKWKFVEYKNKNIEINGVNDYNLLYPDIVKDWGSGQFTISQLSKKYNVHINCIKHHFNQNNIYWKPTKKEKGVLQLDKKGNIVNTWDSGQQIKRELKYNASAISECCRGVRKQYKGYNWRFKNER